MSWPNPRSMYREPLRTHIPKIHTKFATVTETNLAVHFTVLEEKQVTVGTFLEMASVLKDRPIEQNQSQSDVVFDFAGSQVLTMNNIILGVDQKATRKPGIGRNQALSDLSGQRYSTTLNSFLDTLNMQFKGLNEITEIKRAVTNLKKSSLDFQTHQEVWVSTLHLFPPNWRPPLFLPRNFQLNALNEASLKAYQEAEERVLAISDRLYYLKVPLSRQIEVVNPEDYLYDSFLQKVLGEV